MKNIMETIADRCRIPWYSGTGAIQMRLDVIIPIILLPSCILLGTISPVMTIGALISMPLLMFIFYRMWRRQHSKVRTKFFSTWANTSIVFSYFVFQTFVVAFRKILLWEFLLLFTALLALLYGLYLTKKNPGFLKFGLLNHEKTAEDSGKIWQQNSEWIESLKNNKKWKDIYLNGESPLKLDANGENISVCSHPDSTNNIVNENTAPMIPVEEVTWVDSRPVEGKLHWILSWLV